MNGKKCKKITITTIEYGQIFHVRRIGKNYCKNMKYRITRKMVPIKKRARSFPIIVILLSPNIIFAFLQLVSFR